MFPLSDPELQKIRHIGEASLRHLFDLAHRGSGQSRYLAHFLAGLYNGTRFPFDLTDLRCLDTALFEHCVNVLRMDATPLKEVHLYFEDGENRFEQMIRDWGVKDQGGDVVERATHAALDVGCNIIQASLGQRRGDFAGLFFSGDRGDAVRDAFQAYYEAERQDMAAQAREAESPVHNH